MDTSKQCFAHTLPGPTEDWEPLDTHLQAVANLASNFAGRFGAAGWGKLIGCWHDIGKYSPQFQDYLRTSQGHLAHLETVVTTRVDHSTAGAVHASKHFADVNPAAARVIAYCIAGHHAGLADWLSGSNSSLNYRLSQEKPETIAAIDAAPSDLLDLPLPAMPSLCPAGNSTLSAAGFQISVFVRMLFSALVDADFLATEEFMNPPRRTERAVVQPSLAQLDNAVDRHLQQFEDSAKPTAINQVRREIRQACVVAAKESPGIFSLTVPTGGGKTLSSLSFALKHALNNKQERIIYAIPYTSIIEQTAEVFRQVLGELAVNGLLEHHSNLDPQIEKETPWTRLAAENWDAPLVLTTNVQFFDSLFANRTSRCRKLHRIVGSVIILDEAQILPVNLLQPCLAALQELVRNYGCTIVLCTATQPAIGERSDFPIGLEGVREIIPQPQQLYQQMSRVSVEHIGRQTDGELVIHLNEKPRFLCIVNTTRHAADLHEILPTGSFHLSSRMCPQHRSQVITTIKRQLRQENQPCRVVSTQLIEAGVDIDFPVVYRAMTGIDSIAQAAGRCNREGRLAEGRVYIFDTEQPPPPGMLRQTAEAAGELVGQYEDLLSLEAIQHYFRLHYWQKQQYWDAERVMECFRMVRSGQLPELDFRSAAERFQFIKNQTQPIIIPWESVGKKLIDTLRQHELPTRNTRRALQRFTVQIHSHHWNRLVALGAIELVHDQYPVLIDSTRYRSDRGLSLDIDPLLDPADLMQ